ncbi:protein disulfide-isomerase precursor [Ciborinia camelliae]|nr:protein disulfide-isomerase precursor [Ciborinia camelliae]
MFESYWLRFRGGNKFGRDKKNPVEYTGSRTVSDMVKFIKETSTHKVEVAYEEPAAPGTAASTGVLWENPMDDWRSPQDDDGGDFGVNFCVSVGYRPRWGTGPIDASTTIYIGCAPVYLCG